MVAYWCFMSSMDSESVLESTPFMLFVFGSFFSVTMSESVCWLLLLLLWLLVAVVVSMLLLLLLS